jgi:hypothetical protein
VHNTILIVTLHFSDFSDMYFMLSIFAGNPTSIIYTPLIVYSKVRKSKVYANKTLHRLNSA